MPSVDPNEQRIAAFGRAIYELRREVEAHIGIRDARHIEHIRKLSTRLEIVGRSLLHFSFEPFGFAIGTGDLWAHKLLEVMKMRENAASSSQTHGDGRRDIRAR